MDAVLYSLVEKMQSYSRANLTIEDSPIDLNLAKSIVIHFGETFGPMTKPNRMAVFSKLYGRELSSTKKLTIAEALAYLRMAEHSNDYLYAITNQIVEDVVMDSIQHLFKLIGQEECYLEVTSPLSKVNYSDQWIFKVRFAMTDVTLFEIEDKNYRKCVAETEKWIKENLAETEETL